MLVNRPSSSLTGLKFRSFMSKAYAGSDGRTIPIDFKLYLYQVSAGFGGSRHQIYNVEWIPLLTQIGKRLRTRLKCPPAWALLERNIQMAKLRETAFDAAAFLAKAGLGRRIVQLKPKQAFFSQGGPADSIFYLQSGRAKLTVVSKNGKEAIISLFVTGDFVGEDSLVTVGGVRLATASAITACSALKIEREEMIRVMHEEHSFSDLFVTFLLARGMRTQADLVDQLFNSSEKRLARILLLLAEFGKPGEPESVIPEITQETLADMIGTTRPRVSFFMNRFRKLGFIEYNGRIRVHKSLLNVILHD